MKPTALPDPKAARAEAQAWAQEILTRRFLVLDLETTGLGDDAEIVQVGILQHIPGQPDTTLLDALVRPGRTIENSHIHGVTDAMVALAPRFWAFNGVLSHLLENETVLIYNAEFDCGVLERYFNYMFCPSFDAECVMKQYSKFVGEWSDKHGDWKRQKLPGGDHSAIGDCRATLALVRRMAGEVADG